MGALKALRGHQDVLAAHKITVWGGSSPFPRSFEASFILQHMCQDGFSKMQGMVSLQLGSGVMNSKGSKSAVSFLQSHGCQTILGYFYSLRCLLFDKYHICTDVAKAGLSQLRLLLYAFV